MSKRVPPKFDRKVIISCAITGSIHTPSMSPYLPITPDQIAENAIDACKAGASIVHLHARDPTDGHPSADPELFRRFLTKIKQNCDVVCNITTGGGAGMSREQRWAGALDLCPEICSCTPGSTNFSLIPVIGKRTEWKYDWELKYLEASHKWTFSNSFDEVEQQHVLFNERGIKMEYEIFDLAHIQGVQWLQSKNLVPGPVWLQGVCGVLGSLPPSPSTLFYLKQNAEEALGVNGVDFHFSALGAGANQMRICVQSAIMGGHCRVGLEDAVYLERGVLAKSNAEQVKKIRGLLEGLGYQIATPTEVREMLQLKGMDKTRF